MAQLPSSATTGHALWLGAARHPYRFGEDHRGLGYPLELDGCVADAGVGQGDPQRLGVRLPENSNPDQRAGHVVVAEPVRDDRPHRAEVGTARSRDQH